MAMNMAPTVTSNRKTGKMNLNHFSNGIPAIPRTAIRNPFVGIIRFEKPSPDTYTNTVVCLVRFKRSPKGTMSGIDTSACPLAEGIKKFKMLWNTNIPSAAQMLGRLSSNDAV